MARRRFKRRYGIIPQKDLETLESFSPTCKKAVIVGGGLIGIELAEMLRSRNIEVTFLVREKSFWDGVLPFGESQMINRHIKEHHIDLRLETGLLKILSDQNGNARAVVTDKNETIECQIVGLTAGVAPNIDFLKNSGIELGRGVKVNRYLETNIKDVFAIGDCAEQHEAIGQRRPIEAVWYTGRMMGETLAQTLTGKPTQYNPGHWFNSAKFLDIEYQTMVGFGRTKKTTKNNFIGNILQKIKQSEFHSIKKLEPFWASTHLESGCVTSFLIKYLQKINRLIMSFIICRKPISILNFSLHTKKKSKSNLWHNLLV